MGGSDNRAHDKKGHRRGKGGGAPRGAARRGTAPQKAAPREATPRSAAPRGVHSSRRGVTTLRVAKPSLLLAFLLDKLPDEGRNSVKSFLSHRQVSVDGEVVTRFNHLLAAGERVVIARGRTTERRPEGEVSAPGSSSRVAERGPGARESLTGLRILFEDAHLIVIDKEAGLLSIATGKERQRTAYSILWDHVRRENPTGRVFVVHRLDRESSGVMVYAKSVEAKRGLQDAWREAVEQRSYAVVVEGVVTKQNGTVISWLKEDRALIMRSSPTDNGGQRAVSHYRVVKRGAGHTLLEVELETGRKNQIRAHMQSIGHSVVGDAKYGASGNPLGRLALHAHLLSFRHPITGKPMSFESPVPPGFSRLVAL